MIERLKKAWAMAGKLSQEGQEELASAMLALMGANDDDPVELTPEDWEAAERSMAQADSGKFASNEEIEAIWKKHA